MYANVEKDVYRLMINWLSVDNNYPQYSREHKFANYFAMNLHKLWLHIEPDFSNLYLFSKQS